MIGCTSCGEPLSLRVQQKIAAGKKVTGLCRPCYDAKIRVDRRCGDCGAKVAAYRAIRCQPCNNRWMAADRAREERRIERALEAHRRPDVRQRHDAANRRIAERKMMWCPQEHRAAYHEFVKRVGKEEARARILARMTPFERQLARVYSGATVSRKWSPPAQESAMSLTGGSLQ